MYFKKYAAILIIIALNIIVFAVMVFSGISYKMPDVNDIITYGGNFNALIYGGEYYRLITYQFIHIGILHLAANMLALFSLGRVTEQSLGKMYFITVYLFSGIAGGLVSALWHSFQVSAGASGAIMGLAGANLAIILSSRGHEKYLSHAIAAIIFNLIIGYKITFIDNACHVGGLMFGFVFTLILLHLNTEQRIIRQTQFVMLVISSCTLFCIAVVELPASSWNYYVAFNRFINYDRASNRNYGSGYMAEDALIKKTEKNIETWKECRFMLDTLHDLHPELAADVYLLKFYTYYKIKALSQYKKAISEAEYQLIDSMDVTNAMLANLPKVKHGIMPAQTIPETDKEKSGMHSVKIFYDDKWQVTDSSNASYFRIAEADSLDRINGFAYDYYIDGQIQMKGVYMNDIKHDVYRYYYHNGNYESIGKYAYEQRIGKWKTYYENGQLEKEVYYTNGLPFIKNYCSEGGTPMVVNGNGVYRKRYSNGIVQDSGLYQNGVAEGAWLGKFENGKTSYTELYAGGNLIKGVAFDNRGNAFYYTQVYTDPEPLGGDMSYYEYLQQNLNYPQQALAHKVEGIVLVDLAIDSTGSLTNAEIVNKLGFGCNEEALRLVKTKTRFAPAVYRGQFVNATKRIGVKFAMPRN